jgi:phospholipid/cholesterol/gamma-HCH transport system permease protein
MTEARAHFDEAQGALIASGVWHAEAAVALPNLTGKTVRILDGAGVTQLDTNGAWLLLTAARPRAGDPMPELRAFQPRHLAMLQLVAQHAAATAAHAEPRHEGVLELIGRSTLEIWAHVTGLLNFVGRLFLELARMMGKPGSWRWREFGTQLGSIFAGAIPIVTGMGIRRSNSAPTSSSSTASCWRSCARCRRSSSRSWWPGAPALPLPHRSAP